MSDHSPRTRYGRVAVLLLAAVLFTLAAVAAAAPAVLTIADFNFNDLTRGQIVTSYTVNGITMFINVSGSNTDTATIFDTSVPFPSNAPNPNDFGDPDLGSPNNQCVPPGPGESAGNLAGPGLPGANCTAVGKALIIAENTTDDLDNSTMDFDDYLSGSGPGDGLIDWPDDEADGGVITLTFEEQSNPGTPIPVTINFFELLDIEASEAAGLAVDFFSTSDCSGAPFAEETATGYGDNTFEQFQFDVSGVQCVTITFPASGAIPRIVVSTGDEFAALGDYVWFDENENGIQDEPAENGVNGVTVNLLDDQGNVIDTTVTANDTNGNPGYYIFNGLTPGVTYQVEFLLPSGYTGFTTPNSGTDSQDSDADQTTGRTQQVTLASGEANPTLDAGLVDEVTAVTLAGLDAGSGTVPPAALAALILLALGSAALLRRARRV